MTTPATPEEIIHKLKPTLHESAIVDSSTRHLEQRDEVSYSNNAEQKIGAFIGRLEKLEATDSTRERLKNHIVDSLLVKQEDIPEAYWLQQKRLARDNGKNVILSEGYKEKTTRHLQDAQYTGLESWVNYLEQAQDQYPMWFKVYAIEGMSKLGIFNYTKGVYNKRSKGTVATFPQLDPLALEKTFDAVMRVYREKTPLDDDRLDSLVKNGNFNKIYSKFLLETKAIIPTPEREEDVNGEWHKYTEENVQQLAEAAQGTPWCIAGEQTAQSYLVDEKSEFYLFHLKDSDQDKTSPTAAASIRTVDGKVAEVSGLKSGSNQYLEDSLVPTVLEKLRTLPGAEDYALAIEDKKRLMAMDKKFEDDEDFTIEELRFLYEIDRNIQYVDADVDDPRMEDFKENVIHHRDQFIQAFGEENAYWMVFSPQELAENLGHLVATGIPVDIERLIQTRLSSSEVSYHLETFIHLKDTFDINILVEKTLVGRIATNRLVKELLGAGVDAQLLVDNIAPEYVIYFFDMLTNAGAKIDPNQLVAVLQNYEIYRSVDKFLIAGANPNEIVKKLAPGGISYWFEKLTRAGAKIDFNEIIERLSPSEIGYGFHEVMYLANKCNFEISADDLARKLTPEVVNNLEVLAFLEESGVSQSLINAKLSSV